MGHDQAAADFADAVRQAISDETSFIEAIFQGAQRNAVCPWARVTVRPVALRDGRRLQFVYSDGIQDTTQNMRPDAAAAAVDELLALPFKSIRLRSRGESLRVQFSKRGRPTLHRERGRAPESVPLEMAHDRQKRHILNEGEAIPFLQAIGIMTADGRVRADQRRKFSQINEFLRLLDEAIERAGPDDRPLRVVDLGCGNAALTFATYHFLNNVRNRPATMVGVDIKAPLMARHRQTAAALGWDDLRFVDGQIDAYQPSAPPDIVLALHACDTATDDALAQAVRWGSPVILSAPCCHHHLQAQLERSELPPAAQPLLRHGILRERLGDVLTDAFRAHILRLLGYRTDVIEFVPVEHTPKNLMIRATRGRGPVPPELVAEYQAMKTAWAVRPRLEELLQAELRPVLE